MKIVTWIFCTWIQLKHNQRQSNFHRYCMKMERFVIVVVFVVAATATAVACAAVIVVTSMLKFCCCCWWTKKDNSKRFSQNKIFISLDRRSRSDDEGGVLRRKLFLPFHIMRPHGYSIPLAIVSFIYSVEISLRCRAIEANERTNDQANTCCAQGEDTLLCSFSRLFFQLCFSWLGVDNFLFFLGGEQSETRFSFSISFDYAICPYCNNKLLNFCRSTKSFTLLRYIIFLFAIAWHFMRLTILSPSLWLSLSISIYYHFRILSSEYAHQRKQLSCHLISMVCCVWAHVQTFIQSLSHTRTRTHTLISVTMWWMASQCLHNCFIHLDGDLLSYRNSCVLGNKCERESPLFNGNWRKKKKWK